MWGFWAGMRGWSRIFPACFSHSVCGTGWVYAFVVCFGWFWLWDFWFYVLMWQPMLEDFSTDFFLVIHIFY